MAAALFRISLEEPPGGTLNVDQLEAASCCFVESLATEFFLYLKKAIFQAQPKSKSL